MKVQMISFTHNPLGVIASAKGLMRGIHKYPSDFTDEEKVFEFKDCTKTALLGPFEFANFVFDFVDVTRSFTHQIVRTRTASFVQESMRFSAKVGEQFKYSVPDSVRDIPNQGGTALYLGIMENIQRCYENLIDIGIPVENARGVLPTNILTSIIMGIDYRNLVQMCESRLCHQTQKEHREAMLIVKDLVMGVEPLMGNYLQPSCGHFGFCSWEGSLDRKCPLQEVYPFRSEIVENHKKIKGVLKKNGNGGSV